ncbi:hypothetical protein VO226_09520 [Halomonas elongata]|uniref:hypothetical protein n=1 Tax=Halomonas elongata TaxID=2746 RepID=UPI000DCD3EC1|nr:hypothetical protein [Halomonas elongata]RAW08257.1 hypothetical protein DKQ62_04325 [Halomonas elongata]WVI70182.1 hypothetical protein VO226_09520 [Halomonas elongata]
MKPWIAGTLCLVLGVSVHVNGQGMDRTGQQCERVSNLAAQVMERRQLGTSKEHVREQLGQAPATHHLIEAAFDQPRYHTQIMQDRARQDFALSFYRSCIQRPGS